MSAHTDQLTRLFSRTSARDVPLLNDVPHGPPPNPSKLLPVISRNTSFKRGRLGVDAAHGATPRVRQHAQHVAHVVRRRCSHSASTSSGPVEGHAPQHARQRPPGGPRLGVAKRRHLHADALARAPTQGLQLDVRARGHRPPRDP